MVHQVPRRLDLGCHVGELEMDSLEGGHRLAELFALRGVGNALVQCPFCDSQRQGSQADPAGIERLQEVDEAFAGLAQNVFLGDDRILENEFPGVRRAPTELVLFLSGAHAGSLYQLFGVPYPERAGFLEVDGVFCDYERRDAAALFAAVGLRPSGHQENLADTRMGDEQLGAVQHIMVALFFGNGLRAAGIRARPGLREPEAAEHPARGQMGNESFLLLLRPKVHDGGRTEGRVSRNGDRVAGIHLGQLLDDDQVGRVVHARATENLRPRRA